MRESSESSDQEIDLTPAAIAAVKFIASPLGLSLVMACVLSVVLSCAGLLWLGTSVHANNSFRMEAAARQTEAYRAFRRREIFGGARPLEAKAAEEQDYRMTWDRAYFRRMNPAMSKSQPRIEQSKLQTEYRQKEEAFLTRSGGR